MSDGVKLRVPFNRLTLLGDEFRYAAQAIEGTHISGDGPFSRRVHELLENALGVPKALLTTSCTHALEMAALLLRIEPGDEVILPSFTFVSTANAFVLRGAKPVFVDIRPDTLNLDEQLLPRAMSARTKAIVAVHYAGVGCEMDSIVTTAAARGIAVVEDNAHGLFATYRGRYLGTFGTFATQSFHETKNFTCGEGGALIVNDPRYIEEAEIVREKGTNRSRFFRGQVDKYTWVELGSSYVLSDMLAAFLYAQLEQRDVVQEQRRRIWERYARELRGWAEANGVALPYVPDHCGQAYHMFYLRLPSLRERTRFIQYLRESGINAVFHYVPLHSSPMARSLGVEARCPVTDRTSDQLVRLPFFNALRDDEQDRIIETIATFAVDQ
jgi:dTDP-4-amino-4,6-dideoxygalactose transaminase